MMEEAMGKKDAEDAFCDFGVGLYICVLPVFSVLCT